MNADDEAVSSTRDRQMLPSLVSCDLVLRLAHPVAQKVGFYEATNSVSPLLLQAQPRRGERAQASYTALNENLTEYAGGS